MSIRTTGTQTPLTGTVSDSTGVFRINRVKNGTYTLTASFIGYKSVEKEFTISPTARNVNVKNILLEEDSQVIDEIKVVGQRAQMRFEIDKKVFDVESNISQAGGSASELLENIPSVEVDNEGEISLRGNSSVTIWINGKASGLSADNQAQILEQIPAESIERIELITNPSAKFSPEGTSGIINIILKKNRKAGYYGSFQVGADILGGYNASGSINYSSGKIESYLNVGYRQRKSEGKDNTDRINLDDQGNPVSYLNQKGWNDRDGGSLFTRAGLTLHLTQTDHSGTGIPTTPFVTKAMSLARSPVANVSAILTTPPKGATSTSTTSMNSAKAVISWLVLHGIYGFLTGPVHTNNIPSTQKIKKPLPGKNRKVTTVHKAGNFKQTT